jgi:hypothetical protein
MPKGSNRKSREARKPKKAKPAKTIVVESGAKSDGGQMKALFQPPLKTKG